MEVIFNNPQMVIINYPGLDAVELFDKRSGRGGLMQGSVALRFFNEFNTVLASGGDEEALEDLFDDYSTVLSQPLTRH
ncbi:DUF3567 family protein [Denitratisoma oestradiolicum]|uniref:DUF3567 domain-containing protein n=1 Tax=Denitratisoma oestradiolicum TaxID=311182 RepID=A0A6S6XVI1_9PROT|nr:DUF3567 family protein [Denitratisoma oestradiolicum]TWO78971.1 hypothetical protein CBW56_17290 [Denitratisoma oestradiolicum]CAB1368213.1 conserved protein of unknown function [Denitratisoma oestradiolicum]